MMREPPFEVIVDPGPSVPEWFRRLAIKGRPSDVFFNKEADMAAGEEKVQETPQDEAPAPEECEGPKRTADFDDCDQGEQIKRLREVVRHLRSRAELQGDQIEALIGHKHDAQGDPSVSLFYVRSYRGSVCSGSSSRYI